MRRGTTPTHTIKLPVEADEIKALSVTYKQEDQLHNVKIVKRKEDCLINGDALSVALTQEETLSLDHTVPVKIQVRLMTYDNKVRASDVIERPVKPCLDDEVME